MSSVPTREQMRKLGVLGYQTIALAPGRRDWAPLLRRGWVETISDDNGARCLPPVQITPDGLRALAAGLERYGRPELKEPPAQLKESPVVTNLRRERDEARDEAREERLARTDAEVLLRRVRDILGRDGA